MAAITILASANHGSNGHSAGVSVGAFSTLRLDVAVASCTAAAKPTLDVEIEHSSDNANWTLFRQLRSMNAVETQRLVLVGFDAYVRVKWSCHSMAAGVEPAMVWGITGDSV